MAVLGARRFRVLVSDRLPGFSDHSRIVSAQRDQFRDREFGSFGGEVGRQLQSYSCRPAPKLTVA